MLGSYSYLLKYLNKKFTDYSSFPGVADRYYTVFTVIRIEWGRLNKFENLKS